MGPRVPLPALVWGRKLYEQGDQRAESNLFQSPPGDSPKPTHRELDLVLITETFACLSVRGRCMLSSPLGDRLWEVPAGVSPYFYLPMETKQTVFFFLIFCLDLSGLNIAAWDTKDKTEHLFAFHCNMEMFSRRLKSWSSQTFQAPSRQCHQRWPEAHCPSCHHINQRTKKLPTSLQQLQLKHKTSDNRWDQTDGGVEGKKHGNIRQCDRQGSRHIGSPAVVKFFFRHHILRLYLESYRFYTLFSGKWAVSRCQLWSILEMRLVFRSIQVIFSLLFLWKVKM